MGRSVSKSTLGAWLTKKAWLSLAAVVVGLLAASIGMSLPGSPVVSAQTYDAEVEDIWVDPSTVYRYQVADVYARFHNLESEGSFDIRIEVDPPTGEASELYYENVAIGSDQKVDHAMAYLFLQTGSYTIHAEIYDIRGRESGWDSDNRFDRRTETFEVENRAPSIIQFNRNGSDPTIKNVSQPFGVSARDADRNLTKWKWEARRKRSIGIIPLPDFVYTPGEQTLDRSPVSLAIENFSYAFDTTGDWTVKVTFTDSEGESDSETLNVKVYDPITVQLGATEYTVSESAGTAAVTVTTSGSLPVPFSVRLSTSEGTAESPNDFTAIPSAVIYFGANETTQTLNITIFNDLTVELDETFTVELERPSTLADYVTVSGTTATVTIEDDDTATVGFTASKITVDEDSGSFEATLAVTASTICPIAYPIVVHFSHTDPDDALSSGSTVPSSAEFSTCQTRRVFEVDIGDVRGTEEVVFTLDKVTSSRGGTSDGRVSLGNKSLTVTIRDSDDPSVDVRFGRTYMIVNENVGSIDVPVTISASPVEDVSVNLIFRTSDDTADIGDDFSLPGRRYVTFEADTTTLTQNITVTILDSVDVELAETFFAVLQLASGTRASIPEFGRVLEVEIFDDDTGTVGFVDDEVEVNEGDSFRLGFSVSASAGTTCPIQFPVDVHFSYTDPGGALSPIATSADVEHVSGKTYKALFYACQRSFYFTVSTRDVSADAEAGFTLDSIQHPNGTAARTILRRPSTMTVKVLNGRRPTGTVNVTVASRPSGRTVTVDGTNRTAPYTATWNSGSSHTLNAPSPQNITGVSSRYAFSRWSHGGSRSQTVSPTSNSNYTANFTLQHFLSTRSSPTGPGVAGGGQWYNHNSTAFVGPAPTVAGYNFSYWRKDFKSIGTDPAGVSVTVDGPILVEAVFTPAGENRAPTIADDDLSPSTESIILFAGATQTFEARATDLDNNISSVVWYVDDVVVWDPGSDASIALTGDFPSSYDHTFSYPDTFIVKVTFTDAEGATASHSWTVQADPATEESAPSVVRIAPEEEEISLYTTQTQDFTVEATDVDGDIAKWKWVVDKAGVLTDGHEEEEEFDEETGSITKEFSHPFDDDGTYTVTVTFTDSEGESGSVEWEVEVEDGPDLAVEDVEIRATSNPTESGGSIQVEVKIQNRSDADDVAFELPFYVKDTGSRFIRLIDLEPAFVPEVDVSLTSQLRSEYSDSPIGADETRYLRYTVRIPSDLRSGPFWICVQIEHKESTTDPIPDPKGKNNADCALTYVLSSPEVARWIHPVAPVEDYVGRFWFGIPRSLFDPTKTKESIYDAHTTPEFGLSAENYFDSRTRVELYRNVALELAARKALIETEGHLAVVALKEHIKDRKDANDIVGTIISLYEPIHDVVKGSSDLLSFASTVLDFFDVAVTGFDLYMAILINRSINIDKALDTLAVLDSLDIDDEHDGSTSEWRRGVSKARADVMEMASKKSWERAMFAAEKLALELISSAVKAVLGVLAKAGVVVHGIALGSAQVGAIIFAIFAILAALVAADAHWDNLFMSFMATQVYAELYDKNASGDRLEVLTYAKYVSYDRAYQSEDNWLTTVGSILRGGLGNANQFKEEAATLRDAALEEARAVIQVAEIEFDPSHYFLEVGEELKLAPTFISVSGNKMIGFGVEWTNYAGVNEAIDIDVSSQVVIGRAPGDARVVASIGDVHGSVTFTVIGNSICSNGAVADVTNLGLLDDCEALLVARDTLAGTATLNWSETTPITQWNGVSLGGTPQRVTRLSLAGEGLSGTIPSVLGRLSMLTHLNLRSNDGLTGEIPSELGYLSNLRVLNLHSNSHSGSIPDLSGASSLEELYLPNNADYDADDSKIDGTGLTGGIPTWLNGMTNMRELWFWGNSLSGSIPDLSGMSSLQKLKLANNDLTGGVPDGSMLPPNMTWLIIDRNPLGGTIPDLSSLSRLKLLWLHSNELTGSIPAGSMFPASLDDLNLRDNMLTGTIPDLSNLDMLTRLRLHNNSLSGEVPATLGGLDSLTHLWLHNEVHKGLGNNMLTSIAAGVGGLADTLIQIALKGNPWADDACVPAELANVAKNDYVEASIEVCSAGDGS